MKRFMSSAASSSSATAEPHATMSSSFSSAEQPVASLHLKISSIRDVQRWLAEEHVASWRSVDVQRIREAVAVLAHPKPRQADVRPLQNKWQVAQKKNKASRQLGGVVDEFKGKVIKAEQNLQQQQQLAGRAQQPVIVEISARQRKIVKQRIQASAAEKQRPAVMAKASVRQSKRNQCAGSGSVEQPAPQLGGPSMPRNLQECGDWLRGLPAQTSAQSKPIQRLHSAMSLLQSRSSRQKREEILQLLGSWDVSQKAKGRKRKYDEGKADLLAKVVEEARRLKRMQDAYEPPSLDASTITAGTCFSAIQTAVQHESIER